VIHYEVFSEPQNVIGHTVTVTGWSLDSMSAEDFRVIRYRHFP
jgi:hypothetical protein